jgi:lysophospholipase L1-like esterase
MRINLRGLFPNLVLIVLAGLSLILLWGNARNAKMYPSNLHTVLYSYVFPLVLFLAFAGMLKLKESYRSNVAFAAACVLLPLYGAEYFLQRPIDATAREWVNRTGMTDLDMIVHLRARGVQAYPCVYELSSIGQSKIQTAKGLLQPLGGISRVTTVFCIEGDRIAAYDSDDHGFNNPQRNWEQGAKILAVGDSFVQGYCVAPNRTLTADLNREMGPTVGLGMKGNGPFEELGLIKEFFPYLHPQVVLWFYFEGNDLADTHRDKSDPILSHYLEEGFSQDLYHRQDEIDPPLKKLADPEGEIERKVPSASPFFSFLKLRVFRARLHEAIKRMNAGRAATKVTAPLEATEDLGLSYNSSYTEEDVALFGKILRMARDYIATSEGRLVFVYLPAWERYGKPQAANGDRSRVLQMVNALGIPMVDINATFSRKERPTELFLYTHGHPGHYNAEGYQLVADSVRDFLEKEK